MLIKKIKIENFRQFVGIQEIEFSTDKEQNVTLVMGENGSGKTTLSQAFMWCLYGVTPGFAKKDELLSNLKQSDPGVMMKVSIEMIHEESTFTLERSQLYHSGRLSSSHVRLDYFEAGESKQVFGERAIGKIQEILPQELSKYFFLTGENIDTMSSEIKMGKSKNFAEAVNSLLGLDYYKKSIKHLKEILKKYNNIQIPSAKELNNATEKLAVAEKKLDENSVDEKKLQDEIRKYGDEIFEIQIQLKSMKSAEGIQDEKESLEQQKTEKLKRLEEHLENAIEEFSGVSNRMGMAPYFFSQAMYRKELETLNEILSIPPDDVPEKLHADLIDWIEHRHECLCGAKVEEGMENYDRLENYRKIIPPESISTLTRNEKEKIISNFRQGEKLFERFQTIQNYVEYFREEVEGLDKKIEELENKLKNLDDTSELQKRLSYLKESKENKRQALEGVLKRQAELNHSKSSYEKERDEALQKSKEGQFVLKCKDVVKWLADEFDKRYKTAEEDKRTELIAAVKKAFSKIYGDAFSIEIDSNYNIKTNPPLEKSTGQGMSIIFAFLAGLLSVIQNSHRNGTMKNDELDSYPLVFDAPFSALDKKRISSICEVLPKVSSQIMIFVKDTDGEVAKKHLGSKIGKNYQINKKNGQDDFTEICETAIS